MLTTYPNIHIRQLEGVLGFTRQGYYQYWQRQSEQVGDDLNVVRLVRLIRQEHPRIGGRKLYSLLQREFLEKGIKIGRDAFFDLLARNKLLIRKRRRRVKTTFSGHRLRKYPNLTKELIPDRPNQLWVADITYWFTQYGCLYISLITDAYSKRIMGYCVGPSLETAYCREALQMALKKLDRRQAKDLIHHSDRGIQYCSTSYTGLLHEHQIQISMTEHGDPLENPVAERVNGILKNEYLIHRSVHSLAQAEVVLEQTVFLYNYKRPHLSCNMLVPDQAYKGVGKLKRRWKNSYTRKRPVAASGVEKRD